MHDPGRHHHHIYLPHHHILNVAAILDHVHDCHDIHDGTRGDHDHAPGVVDDSARYLDDHPAAALVHVDDYRPDGYQHIDDGPAGLDA